MCFFLIKVLPATIAIHFKMLVLLYYPSHPIIGYYCDYQDI